MRNKERITITIDPDLLKRIVRVADEREESVSAIIERMAREEIDGEEQIVKVMDNPVVRELTLKLMESPRLLRVIGSLVQEQVTDDDLVRIEGRAKRMREKADRKRRTVDGLPNPT